MDTVHFGCTRCGSCCRASIPLGLAEALDHDRDFLLALVLRAQTWNLGDFSKNRPEIPLSHDELLTTLAFRKDKLALDASRDIVFRSGLTRVKGERVASFVSVTACGLGEFAGGRTFCPALDEAGTCSIYETRPLGCRVFPLDPLYPEMLQNVPLQALASRLPCDFSDAAPALFENGRLTDPAQRELLEARQEAIRRDSLFLPYYGVTAGRFKPMPSLTEALVSLKGNGRLDLPFVPALVYLTAAGHISPRRAEECLERQLGLARAAVDAALGRKDKAERARTAVLRNCVALMERFVGRIERTVDEAEGQA